MQNTINVSACGALYHGIIVQSSVDNSKLESNNLHLRNSSSENSNLIHPKAPGVLFSNFVCLPGTFPVSHISLCEITHLLAAIVLASNIIYSGRLYVYGREGMDLLTVNSVRACRLSEHRLRCVRRQVIFTLLLCRATINSAGTRPNIDVKVTIVIVRCCSCEID